MTEPTKYEFIYSNVFCRMLTMVTSIIVIYALLIFLSGLFPGIYDSAPLAVPVVFAAGLVAVLLVTDRVLYRLFVFCGIGEIYEDRVDIKLKFKKCSYPFDTIKKVTYYDMRKNFSLAISVKKSLGLSIEIAPSEKKEPHTLQAFYEALAEAIKK